MDRKSSRFPPYKDPAISSSKTCHFSFLLFSDLVKRILPVSSRKPHYLTIVVIFLLALYWQYSDFHNVSICSVFPVPFASAKLPVPSGSGRRRPSRLPPRKARHLNWPIYHQRHWARQESHYHCHGYRSLRRRYHQPEQKHRSCGWWNGIPRRRRRRRRHQRISMTRIPTASNNAGKS